MAATHHLTFIAILIIACSKSINGQTKNVAENFRNCWLQDKTKIDNCMLEFWKSTIAQIKIGIPEFNIPPSDPILLDKIDWNEQAPAMALTTKLTNMKIYGISDAILTAAHVDPKARTITFNLTLPVSYVTNDFVVNGTVMLLPISGIGRMNLNVTDMKMFGKTLVEQQGTGLRYSNLVLDVTFNKASIEFVQSSKDPVWDAVASLMNENINLIFDDIKPMVSSKISETMRNLTASAMLKMPAEAFIA
ncbi:hypothetical protein CHUAL_009852 [Chamberlinius hualienensis]